MFIKEIDGQFIFANPKETLRYQKTIDGVIKNAVVFNPQDIHFVEAGYKELVEVDEPETEPNQYIETTYELKDDGKYYEVHTVVDMPEVIFDE
jgi:hypothetical protein